MKKPGIPAVPINIGADHFTILTALKENVEIIGGVRSTPIEQLPSTATLAQVIVALNKVIDRLSRG